MTDAFWLLLETAVTATEYMLYACRLLNVCCLEDMGILVVTGLGFKVQGPT